NPADLVDDHLAMGESQAIMCVKRFAVGVMQVFGQEYLRSPNVKDAARLLEMNKARGFPGMLGSIDCMHWSWKNCPKAWHGNSMVRKRVPLQSLKRWPIKRLGFGMLSLECLDL
uniref:Uncharacterized protein n=1 Tax=Aegilops tauschii subsp. strangulata TaxID=200361 RepID=A0A453AM33_AEGTS